MRVQEIQQVLLPFAPHSQCGEYQYPMERTEVEPFREFNLRYAAFVATGAKPTAPEKILLQWAMLQYLSNPAFRQACPDFKPVVNSKEVLVQFQFAHYQQSDYTTLQPESQHVLAGLKVNEVLESPAFTDYLNLHKESQAPRPTGEGIFKVSFRKHPSIPPNLPVYIQQCDKNSWKPRAFYVIHPEIRDPEVTPNLAKQVQWLDAYSLPDPKLPAQAYFRQLSALPPTPEVVKAFRERAVALTQELKRPILNPNQMEQTLRDHAYEVLKYYCAGKEDRMVNFIPVLAHQVNKVWHVLGFTLCAKDGKVLDTIHFKEVAPPVNPLIEAEPHHALRQEDYCTHFYINPKTRESWHKPLSEFQHPNPEVAPLVKSVINEATIQFAKNYRFQDYTPGVLQDYQAPKAHVEFA